MLRLNTMLTAKGFKRTICEQKKDMWQKGTTAVIRYAETANKPRYVEVIIDNESTRYTMTNKALEETLAKL